MELWNWTDFDSFLKARNTASAVDKVQTKTNSLKIGIMLRRMLPTEFWRWEKLSKIMALGGTRLAKDHEIPEEVAPKLEKW